MVTVTRHAEFEAAHLLPEYPGACANLHGHTYKIEVTVGCRERTQWGMVLDFKVLDQIIKRVLPDHKYLYNEANPSVVEQELVEVLQKHSKAIQGFPFDTSAENMSKWFLTHIRDEINKDSELKAKGVQIKKVKLWETTNSFAECEVD